MTFSLDSNSIKNGQRDPVCGMIVYPIFGLLLSPMLAAASMSFSSVSVIGNALVCGG